MLRSDGEDEILRRTATVRPSVELAGIVGTGRMTRAEALNRLWDYIRTNGLQDPNDKRQIVADEALGRVFGSARASMFDINQHLDAHLR
ncbi:SWIB/MDM2 domain-containing protein [Sphingomonas sp. AX6]|uniref:SWIB/MDM2 domain-containing protein n=1 Tax=Sphingomonas sp. AX6 TaxID=2653171 RepID=UPI0012F3C28C|nr:SWIB/MDM2 domain-containing protein [Sphingomonas sp. AX6]VXC75891.1 hypothetical protein SPHINGOAX6_40342 [Sphingomonas sp. AX6]